MYVSDFYYSYAINGSDSSKTNCYDSSAGCRNSWLHIRENGKSEDFQYEWTMTRYSLPDSHGYYYTWLVNSTGFFQTFYLHYEFSVRPVFYLNSSIIIGSGTGTSIDPFIITA